MQTPKQPRTPAQWFLLFVVIVFLKSSTEEQNSCPVVVEVSETANTGFSNDAIRDHEFVDLLQLNRSKLGYLTFPVDLHEWTKAGLDIRDPRSDSSVLDVVCLCVLDVSNAELSDCQLVVGHIECALLEVSDNFVVATPRFLRIVRPQVDGLPVNADTGLSCGFVKCVLRLLLFHGLRFPEENGY